jgi:hypothetical protein
MTEKYNLVQYKDRNNNLAFLTVSFVGGATNNEGRVTGLVESFDPELKRSSIAFKVTTKKFHGPLVGEPTFDAAVESIYQKCLAYLTTGGYELTDRRFKAAKGVPCPRT